MGFGTVNVGQAQAENNNYLTNEQVGVAGALPPWAATAN